MKVADVISAISKRQAIFVLLSLAVVQLLIFGRSIKSVGFYLDDWLMLSQLASGPQQFVAMVQSYCVHDPRVVIRPLEALWYPLLYSAFHAAPLGYHIVNFVLELVSAALLYFCVDRFSKNTTVAFLTSLFFICYPIHDSTHYWAVCSCVSLSLVFYLASLWFALAYADKKQVASLAAAFCFFSLMIFNYETLLPLAAVSVLMCTVLGGKKSGGIVGAVHAASVGLFWVYQRFLLPSVYSGAYLHQVQLNPLQFFHTVVQGIIVSSPVAVASFAFEQVTHHFGSFQLFDWITLVAIAALSIAGFWLSGRNEPSGTINVRTFIVIGLCTIVVSYTIFGLNSAYMPTLVTMVNRVNTGAAIGWSLLFALLVARLPKRVAPATLTGAMLFFAMTNWSIMQPWVVSWKMQRHLMQIARSNPDLVSDGSVILLNCPRYVMWAPVFDGVWDFQSMLKVATGRKEVNANVVSDRLQIGPSEMVDVSAGYVCGRYPYAEMRILMPPRGDILRVSSADQFVELVSTTAGKFGPSHEVVRGWRASLAGKRGGTL